MSTARHPTQELERPTEPEAQLRVSAYDNVASLLIALLIIVGFFVLLMFVIWLTGRLMFTQTPIPVELLEYAGRGDHAAGFERDMEEPGMEEMEELNEPQIEATLEAVTDLVTSQAAAFDAVEISAAASSKGSGMGDSRPPGPLGEGVTDVIPPWERWEIRFSTTGIDVYARQLDHFGIELGAAGGGSPQVDYAYKLAGKPPLKKPGKPEDEKRIYMSWQKAGGPMAEFDRQLLRQAGIKTDRRMILQFYPKKTEALLYSLEVQEARKAGHTDPREFLKTIFGVRTARRGYEFYVIDQYFRPAPTS
jgi:hypothetical protein